jgi:hypothetical protein
LLTVVVVAACGNDDRVSMMAGHRWLWWLFLGKVKLQVEACAMEGSYMFKWMALLLAPCPQRRNGGSCGDSDGDVHQLSLSASIAPWGLI